MSRVYRGAAAAVLLASTLTCGGDAAQSPQAPQVPQQGTVSLSLVTPAGDDGALLFTLDGPVIGAVVRAQNDLVVFSNTDGAGLLRVAVFGHGLTGTLLTVTVPDVAQLSGYGLAIEEVAGPSNQLRGDLSGYRLTLAP